MFFIDIPYIKLLKTNFIFYHRYFGGDHLKTAMTYHLVARTHSCRGDFRAALTSEKEAYTVYKTKVRLYYFYST